jgi:hypothetical protein
MSLYKIMIFDAGRSIVWASERGLGPGNLEFLDPKWLNAISKGPKNYRFPGPNPIPLALIMNLHASKTYARGCINHRCINSKYSV